MALPEIQMLYAKFASLDEALKHRVDFGGWLFVHEDESGATWFNPQFTASDVMRHFAAKGNGRLI
jgi:hypothetical protein